MLNRAYSYALWATVLVLAYPLGAVAVPLSYSFQTIDVQGATATQALGINDLGQVVGFYSANNTHHGFLWDSNQGFSTIDVPGQNLTEAFDINNSGQIVGVVGSASFILSNLSFSLFNGGDATGINESGQVVGFVFGTTGFLRDGESVSPIAVTGALQTRAYGINDSGQIVGSYHDSLGEHGFVKTGDNFVTIDIPGAFSTDVRGINNVPQIVGSYQDTERRFHGFVSRGLEFDLLDFPGAKHTVAQGINSAHQVVGFYSDASGFHGFVATPFVVDEPESLTLVLLGLSVLILSRLRPQRI